MSTRCHSVAIRWNNRQMQSETIMIHRTVCSNTVANAEEAISKSILWLHYALIRNGNYELTREGA